jgi:hypothetical protein
MCYPLTMEIDISYRLTSAEESILNRMNQHLEIADMCAPWQERLDQERRAGGISDALLEELVEIALLALDPPELDELPDHILIYAIQSLFGRLRIDHFRILKADAAARRQLAA